jgi:uncharacterized protein YfbU (UPF0304 family)
MCQIISNSKEKEKDFEKLLEYLLNAVKEKIKEYAEDPNFNRLMLIQNYIIFFMVLVLNLKSYTNLIKLIFRGKLLFFSELRDNINNMRTRKRNKLLSILSNIFLEEYKGVFFNNNDKELEDLFIEQQTDFSELCSETVTFYDDSTYKKMFQTLLRFDISYNNFFSNNDKISDDEKPSYKLCVAQSLIRVAFSKEKKKFYKEKGNYYEYDLLKRIIDKDMEETREKFGDEYKTLFRKEDLCDDVIKYMFFIFGNSMLIDCFVMPLKKMLKNLGITDELIEAKDPLPMKRDIKKEEFNTLMELIIETLSTKIPDVLKILLKLLYESVNQHFTIDKNNYSPLYTSLIFNFLISPRIQMLYSINPLNCVFVRSLNRILRNTCFNAKFAEGDSLYEFNESIEINYKKLQKLINEKIISIVINDEIKNSLKDLFTEKYLIYPKFLFYWDSQLLCATIDGGVEQIISFEELKSNPV